MCSLSQGTQEARYLLFGAPGTGSGIIEAACAELGLDCEIRDLDARNDEHRHADFAALNPSRKMPALRTPEGEVWTESVAILLALDERYPGVLLPVQGTAERAQAIRWLLFAASEMYPMVEIMDFPERFAPDPATAPGVKARAHEHWLHRWTVLNGAASGDPWFLPSGCSAVDLMITVLSRWDVDPAWQREHAPQVERIVASVLARPSLASVWSRHIR